MKKKLRKEQTAGSAQATKTLLQLWTILKRIQDSEENNGWNRPVIEYGNAVAHLRCEVDDEIRACCAGRCKLFYFIESLTMFRRIRLSPPALVDAPVTGSSVASVSSPLSVVEPPAVCYQLGKTPAHDLHRCLTCDCSSGSHRVLYSSHHFCVFLSRESHLIHPRLALHGISIVVLPTAGSGQDRAR